MDSKEKVNMRGEWTARDGESSSRSIHKKIWEEIIS
jgi:hypothetical protein